MAITLSNLDPNPILRPQGWVGDGPGKALGASRNASPLHVLFLVACAKRALISDAYHTITLVNAKRIMRASQTDETDGGSMLPIDHVITCLMRSGIFNMESKIVAQG